MNCPVCFSGPVKILGERNGMRQYKCSYCFSEGEMEDTAKMTLLKAEAEGRAKAESEDNIQKKIDAVMSSRGNDGERVFEMNINAVLEIRANCGSGSGFLINHSGYGITNTHVVADEKGNISSGLKAKVAGEWVSMKVITTYGEPSSLDDIALIKLDRVPTMAKPVTIGDSSKVKTGQSIYIIGNSLGKGICLVGGHVSDANREGFIMTDANANPGNSGGPVFNQDGLCISVHDKGELSEVVTSITGVSERGGLVGSQVGIKAAGMKCSIPINHVKKLVAATERKLGLSILF